jgi:hypothetical protein
MKGRRAAVALMRSDRAERGFYSKPLASLMASPLAPLTNSPIGARFARPGKRRALWLSGLGRERGALQFCF